MLENILGLTTGASLADLGALAALTSIIVQVLKKVLPKSFPTQLLTIIVGIIVCLIASFLYFGIILKAVGIGLIMGFVVAFVAMNGFDSLKSVWSRFQNFNNDNEEKYIEEDLNENITENIGGEG